MTKNEEFCTKCGKMMNDTNRIVRNLDHEPFCIYCYSEISEHLKKGAFSKEESDGAIEDIKSLNFLFHHLINQVKQTIKDSGKGSNAYLKALIDGERSYCLAHFNKYRSTLSLSEVYEMMLSSSKSLVSVRDLSRDDLSRFSNRLELLYIKEFSKKYPFKV